MKHILKVLPAVAILALGIFSARILRAQAAATHIVSTESFAPLEQWKSAVLSGNPAILKAIYSDAPVADIRVGDKEISLKSELAFWTGLKPTRIKLDILRDDHAQPNLRFLVIQAEISGGADSSTPKYLNEVQTWGQKDGHWRLITVQRTDAARLQQPLNKDKKIYSPTADAHAELKEAEQKAAQEHKRVLVVFGANWCYDCHVLDLAFHRPDFAATLSGYEVVHVDIGDDGKKNNDVAKECDVPLNKGIPAVAVLDGSGKLLVSQKSGEFENARAMTPQAVLAFLNKWKP